MKKIFVSLLAVGTLLSACSDNDGNGDSISKGEGSIKGEISFDGVAGSTRAAATTAIPVTGWANIKQAQMFLYDATGKVAFAYTVQPTAANHTFQWSNVPVGEYTLALVANVNSTTDNVTTSLNGGTTPTLFNDYNVRGLKVNNQVHIDLKGITLPTGHTWAAGQKGYSEASEIFTAYATSKVKIKEGVLSDLTSTPLKLSREVSLLRARINTTKIPQQAKVKFNTVASLISIQKQPVGLGLKTGTFLGGIYETPASDVNRIMVAASGAGTFKTTNPTYGKIIDLNDGFTLWRDIVVFPNAAASENKAPSADAANERKYFLTIAGQVDAGYEFADGSKATKTQPVYWSATIEKVFTKNTIREVNITVESAGYPSKPEKPEAQGGLKIDVSSPEAWNSNIESENINV